MKKQMSEIEQRCQNKKDLLHHVQIVLASDIGVIDRIGIVHQIGNYLLTTYGEIGKTHLTWPMYGKFLTCIHHHHDFESYQFRILS